MEAFAKIDLGREPVPDETTICKFRHLLERHALGPALLEEVNAYVAENGLILENPVPAVLRLRAFGAPLRMTQK